MFTPDYIQTLGFEPIKLLGSGAYGEAWLLEDGRVIKLTSSDAEEYCGTRLFELQNTEAYSRFLPELFEIGEAPDTVAFLHETVVKDFFLGPGHPHFWYIRENLEDFPYPKEEDFRDWQEWRAAFYAFIQGVQGAISDAEKDIERKTNLIVIDSKPANWGLRTESDGTQIIVLRDLVCGDDLMWWDGIEQRVLA